MGLFSFIGKAAKAVGGVLGGVAKAGASVLTHGASDRVLKVLKGRGQDKAVAAKIGATRKPTTQQMALVNKALADPVRPRVVNTVSVLDDARAGGGGGRPGHYAKKPPVKSRRSMKPKPVYTQAMANREMREAGIGYPAKAPRKPAKAPKRAAPTSPAMKAMAARMKALAAQWRAAGGLQGTGQTFFAWKAGK